jgi:mannose-6-phosphate isomerase-like protein (cupin superfamily)
MTKIFEKAAHSVPVNLTVIETNWRDEGFSFGVFRDPPGQEWNGFVHRTDEYVLVSEGKLQIFVGHESAECGPGDLVRIPCGVSHSLKTISDNGSVWLYGYGFWDDINE